MRAVRNHCSGQNVTRLARLSAEPLRTILKLRGKVSALCVSGVPLSLGAPGGVPCASGLMPWLLRLLWAPPDPSTSPPDRLEALHMHHHLRTVKEQPVALPVIYKSQ